MTRFLNNIRDWKPEANDTLRPETFEQFCKSWDRDSKYVYKDSGTATFFYFTGNGGGTMDNKGNVTENGNYHAYHYLCHAHWTSGHSPKFTDGFMNIFPNNHRPESNARFYNFLFDDETSPFKDALPTCVILRDSEKANFPQGLLWTNSEGCDIRIFTNLLIATRLCSGWALDNVWGRLVDLGFTEREALVLTPLFSWAGQTLTLTTSPSSKWKDDAWTTTSLSNTGPWASDQPFGYKMNNANRWDKFSPKRVLNADPIYHEGIKTSSKIGPNPCNYIWNGNEVVFQGPLRNSSILKKGLLANKLPKDLVSEISGKLNNDVPINWSTEY